MKKFIIPEVNSVELTQTDVIMESKGIGLTFTQENYTTVQGTAKAEYEIWKGFNNAQ